MQMWLEAVMLVCFGASWPLAIYRTWKVKNPLGKSIRFLVLIEIGYLAGLLNKLLYLPEDPVRFLYLLNLVMVGIDLGLTLYYRRRPPRETTAG
ncbi:MAG: hypothetical protein LBN38_05650 [Verrucomicrobiota bacterium]|jgi:hypothetical protein|nr:hypothetical protein [Verrucomicrobiota bacterium]